MLGTIIKFGKAERKFEFIGDDKDRQLESLWKDTEIGNVLLCEDVDDDDDDDDVFYLFLQKQKIRKATKAAKR